MAPMARDDVTLAPGPTRGQLPRARDAGVRDETTGLHGARASRAVLEAFGGEPLALLAVRIDRFRALEARYGAEPVDRLLAELGGHLQRAALLAGRCVRPFVARLSQHTFAVVLIGADLDVARREAERLRRDVARARFSLPCSVSVGLAAQIPRSVCADILIDLATTSADRAEQQGGDRVVLSHHPGEP